MGDHDKHHRHDHHKDHEPTAGPSEDDRGPVPELDQQAALRAAHIELAHDRHARILGVSVEGDRTKIIIGSGLKQGVTEGMDGYIPAPGGAMADFVVTHVEERTAIAFVEATPDMIHEHPEVILNPGTKPGKSRKPDQEARIIGVSVVGGRSRITIGNGRLHGAFVGEKVILLGPNGHKIISTEIDEVHGRASFAFVDLPLDHVRDAKVILSPTDHSVQGPKPGGEHHGAQHAPT